MKRSAIVKIDLCESKEYVDRNKSYEGNIREKLLSELHDFVKGIFPDSDKAYPDGSIYSAQGDCIYIVLDRPTVAVRCSIDFMKGWHGKVPSFPDCRTVIDYGEIEESLKTGKMELLGEPFENINKMEKHFGPGEIGVTESITEKSDSTLVQYIRPMKIAVSSSRSVDTYIVNYENPRLINLSALAHALFIVDPSSSRVRHRAFEALLIEALLGCPNNSFPLNDFNEWLRVRNLPEPSSIQIDNILAHSKFLECDPKNCVCWKKDTVDKIHTLQTQFELEQRRATDFIVSKIAGRIGISSIDLQSKIDIKAMTEEYLCAVFLQIRMMANYFRSTGILFERLSSYKDFDYILIKYFKHIAKDRQEEFLLFKRPFLDALKELAERNDSYIASIFHNVLLLYYLNRNSNLSRGQLGKLRGKEIYLDANTFYAHMCKASTFNKMIDFTIGKLNQLGCQILLFNRSLTEYVAAIDYALRKYKQNRHYEFISGGPWIWKEFLADISRYKNDFEFCVALHRFPKTQTEDEKEWFDSASKELSQKGITLVPLQPFLQKDDLGDLYHQVYNLKLKYDHSSLWLSPKTGSDQYENIVLHDSNCLRYLEHHAPNPLEAKRLFVTCDFRLAKIRKKIPQKYEFLVTVPEFYEFMLPYLFLANEMIKQPVEMPNFLLASLLHKELLETMDFKDIFGSYLSSNIDNMEDFKVLDSLSTQKRFKDIKEKFEKLDKCKPEELEKELKDMLRETTELMVEYSNKVKESLAKSIVQDKIDLQEKHLMELKKQYDEVVEKLKGYEEKEKKRKEYYKKQQKKKKYK